MGNPRGVQRDFEELERRRLKAAKLLRAGVPQAEVARRVGVHRQSVSRWAADVDLNGVEALRGAGRAGRKPRLSDEDVDRLGDILESGPEAAGYATNLWTCERVAEVIEREFGVRYHSAHVWRFLVRIGWSCQRPTGRAIERNEEAIARWKRVEWPRINKKPRGQPEPSSLSTRVASRNGRTEFERGDAAVKRRSSSTGSRGRVSRRSRG